jgi:hypothetical protein
MGEVQALAATLREFDQGRQETRQGLAAAGRRDQQRALAPFGKIDQRELVRPGRPARLSNQRENRSGRPISRR